MISYPIPEVNKSICPYCHGQGSIFFQFGSRPSHRCADCHLIYKYKESASDNNLRTKFFKEGYHEMYSADQTGGHRTGIYQHILDLIEAKKGVGRILDIGAGCGFFLYEAKKRGWEIFGIEPSEKSSTIAVDLVGERIFTGTFQEYEKEESFDVVTFINVLELMLEPWKAIGCARRLLKPQGLIYLRVINGLLHTSIYRIACRFGVEKQVGRYLVFHEHCFTPDYVKRLLSDYGFRNINIANSLPSEGNPGNLFKKESYATYIKKLCFTSAEIVSGLSGQKILLGTSLEATAINSG